MDGSSASLIVKIKPKAEEKFRTTAWLLFYILQNFVSTEVYVFSLSIKIDYLQALQQVS